MKKNRLSLLFFYLTLTFAFTSCSDDEPKPEPSEKPFAGIYVLNTGSYPANNSNLFFYNSYTQIATKDIFNAVNNQALGKTGNNMIVYGSKMYIAMTDQNAIYVTDRKSKLLKTIETLEKPRYFTSDNGKVYVSSFTGVVACIDTTEMQIKKEIPVGKYPEQIVISNNKLYVANSDYTYDQSQKTVSVVDLTNDTENKIEVAVNPAYLAKNSAGNIYVLALGNFYANIPAALYKIDASNNVTPMNITATEMTICNDKLYLLNTVYDETGSSSTITVFDTRTDAVIPNAFIKDYSVFSSSPYKLSADEVSGDIYITSQGTEGGEVYIFDSNGNLKKKMSTGGDYPVCTVNVR